MDKYVCEVPTLPAFFQVRGVPGLPASPAGFSGRVLIAMDSGKQTCFQLLCYKF